MKEGTQLRYQEKDYATVQISDSLQIVDASTLPGFFNIIEPANFEESLSLIAAGRVRGGSAIAAAAAGAMWLAVKEGIDPIEAATRSAAHDPITPCPRCGGADHSNSHNPYGHET